VTEECPSDNELLARLDAPMLPARCAEIDAHVDGCSDCRLLLAGAAAPSDDPRPRAAGPITFAVGHVIAGRYTVTRWLASGGMGEVYEVHDTYLKEQVALKVVAAAIADDENALLRLEAEVRSARRVTHESVCRVYDLGFHAHSAERIAFFTMELLRGCTLRQRIAAAGPMDVETALPLIEQIVAALGHAHTAGIVHRDMKSDNVMLVPAAGGGSGERAVVMDFGLARQLLSDAQPLTPDGRAVFGTPDYMSPEQVLGKKATPRSDIYSLGVVIYEMLTGHLPFEGKSPLTRALLRVNQKAPPLGKLLPGVSPIVERCVARCLETKPENRFADVNAVLQTLRGDTRGRRARRTVRKSIGLAIGATVGVSVLAWTLDQRSLPQRPDAPHATQERPRAQPSPVRGSEDSAVAPGAIASSIPRPAIPSATPSATPVASKKRRPGDTRTAHVVAEPPPVPTQPSVELHAHERTGLRGDELMDAFPEESLR
jgi:serine/threonine protein kinase